MVFKSNPPVEILKNLEEIFSYYIRNLEEDNYLIDLWKTLFENFKLFFQEKEELFYFIENNGFVYQEQRIITTGLFQNFHQILYNEGARAFLIKKNIEKNEIIKLFSLFNIPFSKMSYKDQSVKMFIKRENFENIKFFYIENQEIEKQIKENFINLFDKSNNLQNESFELLKEKKEISIEIEEKEVEVDLISEPIKKSLKFIFEETVMAILSQYEKELNLDYKVLLLQALRYLYQEIISFADFKKINFILRNLKQRDDKDLKDLFLEFQESEIFKNLIKAISQIEILKSEDLLLFYDILNTSSQKIFINKILEENITKHREEIYEIISHKLKNDKEKLLEIYAEIDKNKIQNFLFLIQKLPTDFITQDELLAHKNKEIKASIIKICKNISDKNLLEFLDSENLELSMQTLSYIEKFKKESFIPILITRIKKENFYEKEKIEKEKYFEVLSKIGNLEAINFLKELLQEHKLFSSQKKEELRAMAAIALAQTKDPKIKELLLRESKSIANPKSVKEACKRASLIIESKGKK